MSSLTVEVMVPRAVRIAVSIAAAVLICGSAHAEAGESIPWDQKAATELAGQLAESVRDLRQTVRRNPVPMIASGQAAATHRLLDQLRLIRSESNHLHSRLADGEGRLETQPVFRRINELRRSAAENARRMHMPEATLDEIDSARELLAKLARYYGDEVSSGLPERTR